MSRRFSIMVASVLIALLCFQATADEAKVAEQPAPTQLGLFGEARPARPSVLGALKQDLSALLSDPNNQPVVAGGFLLFGFACLVDGARSFQLLVVVLVGLTTFAFMLTQLQSTGRVMGSVAATEIGVFVAFAAWLGWEGTQLMIGLVTGVYLYHLGTGLIALVHDHNIQPPPGVHVPEIHEANNVLVVAGYTASIIVGTFLVNDNGGAQRAFAIIAPLIGAALVAATFEYMLMFYCTTPQGAAAMHTHFAITDLPSVFDLLYMIVFPFHSRSVGFFATTHGNINFGKTHVEVDKVIGVTAWAVLAIMGVCVQCSTISKLKRVKAKEEGDSDSLTTRLLDEPTRPTV